MQHNKKHSSETDTDTKNMSASEASDNSVDVNYEKENNETTNSNENVQEENETTKLNEELEQSKDKYIRLFAEFDNYKRRSAKERMELIQTAGKEIITSLLEVLDDIDRAEKQISDTEAQQLTEGVQLVFNKLRNTLYAKGLKPMISIGTEFDVEKHEAITEVPVDDESKKGKVVDEIVKGYYLNDKLIRFAKVVVGK